MPEPAEWLAVSEAVLQSKTLELLRRNGYRAYHVQDSRRDEPGFPDTIALDTAFSVPWERPVLIVWELKDQTGKVSTKRRWTKGKSPREQPSQQDWLDCWGWLANTINTLVCNLGLRPVLAVGVRRPEHWRSMQEMVGDLGTDTWERMQEKGRRR